MLVSKGTLYLKVQTSVTGLNLTTPETKSDFKKDLAITTL